jgi:hypothetical protein
MSKWFANLPADPTALRSQGPIGSGSHAAAIAFSTDPASRAKLMGRVNAFSVQALGISSAHVPWAP